MILKILHGIEQITMTRNLAESLWYLSSIYLHYALCTLPTPKNTLYTYVSVYSVLNAFTVLRYITIQLKTVYYAVLTRFSFFYHYINKI